MWQIEKRFKIHLGGNTYINVPNLIVYEQEPLFQVRRSDDGMLGIDLDVYDKFGKRVAKFAKGVVVYGDPVNYDVETRHETYTVTEISSGRTILRVQRRGVQGAELDVSVTTYLPNGFLLDAGPTTTNLGGNYIRNKVIQDSPTGILIDPSRGIAIGAMRKAS